MIIQTEGGAQPVACIQEDDQKNDDIGSTIVMMSGGGPLCDDEYNSRKNNDDEVPSTLDKRDVDTTHTPSSIEAGGVNVEKGDHLEESVCMSVRNDEQPECNIVNGICVNGCIVKTISYTAKRRVQNKKTLLWYDRSRKITKPICVRKRINEQTNLAKHTDSKKGK